MCLCCVPRAREQRNNFGADGSLHLRSYQLTGVNWLLFNWHERRPSILADEMGLGKTIQTTAFLQQLADHRARHVRGPFLVVAPLSTVKQWMREIQLWWHDSHAVLYHGPGEGRLVTRHYDWLRPGKWGKVTSGRGSGSGSGGRPAAHRRSLYLFDVVVTTYEMTIVDAAALKKVPSEVVMHRGVRRVLFRVVSS